MPEPRAYISQLKAILDRDIPLLFDSYSIDFNEYSGEMYIQIWSDYEGTNKVASIELLSNGCIFHFIDDLSYTDNVRAIRETIRESVPGSFFAFSAEKLLRRGAIVFADMSAIDEEIYRLNQEKNRLHSEFMDIFRELSDSGLARLLDTDYKYYYPTNLKKWGV